MVSEKEKMLRGDLYDADDPTLEAEHEEVRKLTRKFNNTIETDHEKRRSLLRELFGSAGQNIEAKPPFRCDYGYNIHTGDGFFANSTA